jgi:hypothetical protein|tara:strand:- start:249 stop:563 length:315 start_codon:yes stop_codon:yes gene_type:complete
MNYSQSANPNATNSELDAKKIIPFKQLTSAQRDELIEQYVDIEVDRMSVEDLTEFVTVTLRNDYDKMSDIEFREYILEFEDEGLEDNLYDELVDNITAQTTEVK